MLDAHKIKARPAIGLARWMVQHRSWTLSALRVLSVFALLLCGMGTMYNYGWVPAMACMLGLAVWAFVRRVHAALVAALTACAVLFILDAIVGGVVSSLQTTWTIATSPAGLIALVLVVVVLFMGGGKSEGKPGVP